MKKSKKKDKKPYYPPPPKKQEHDVVMGSIRREYVEGDGQEHSVIMQEIMGR